MAFIVDVTPLGVGHGTVKEKENSLGFQGIQSGMFIKLWNICDHLFICDIYDLNSYAIQSIFGAKQSSKLPHTDCCVITEYSIMHYNKSCRFFFFGIVQFSNMTNSELSLYLIMH
jgi:hypothetical protein